MKDGVYELLLRYELGDFPKHVRARLEEIFRDNPDDAVARLERAAAYLGLEKVTTKTLQRADALTRERSRTSTHRKSDTGEGERRG